MTSTRSNGRADSTSTRPTAAFDGSRVPPSNRDAEYGVIGSVLLKPPLLDEISLRPEDFYDEPCAACWRVLQALHAARRPIDVVALRDSLKTHGVDALCPSDWLARVAQSVPYAANAGYYARIVRDKADRRRLIEIAATAIVAAYDGESLGEAVTALESRVNQIGAAAADHAPVRLFDALVAANLRIDAAMQGQRMGLATGLPTIDERIGGLRNGELAILAARPGLGKTSFASQVAAYNAMQSRLVYFASLEMGRDEIALRLACSRAGVSSQNINTARLRDGDSRALVAASNELGVGTMLIHDPPTLSVAEIRRACVRLQRDGLSLIVVDYLQLLQPDDRKSRRDEQVAAMSRGLKALARELNVPVLCLCQLNRQSERDSRPPILSDLRESGAIEQDADVVFFIHQPLGLRHGKCTCKHRRDEPCACEQWADDDRQLIVAKNRNGPLCKPPLHWCAEFTRFEDSASIATECFDEFTEFSR